MPPSVVNPQPACRKLEVTSLNCLQAIVILLRFVGSTEMEHSFAASPRIFCPLALTFTCWLMNEPNCEIIGGEVSIFRGGAGGLSYVSSGTFRGTLVVGASWPEAMETKNNESRQVITLPVNILKRIIIRNFLCERLKLPV